MERKLAVGLDAGSSRTRCVICELQDGMLRYVVHSDAPSKGWQKGRISDGGAVTESIRSAVAEAEKRAGVTVESAVAGVGGSGVEGFENHGVYEFGRLREIDPGDMHYAVELGAKMRLQDNRMVLQVAPQNFTVDGRAGFTNPRSMPCSRLEANVYLLSILTHDHQALVNAVHQAHLGVEDTMFEPVAAAYACVIHQERNRGVAIVDIGAQSTEYAIYDGDALLRAGSVPVTADHFTRDVTYGLTVSHDDAEALKRQYGCAILGLTADNSLIEVPSSDGRPAREAPRKLLNEILEARAEELFLYIRSEIARAHMEQSLYEGIVLTGGGALLNGICDMAEKVVNCQSRKGLPIGIEGWPEEINDPAWSVAAGLSMYSAKLKTKREWKKSGPGLLGWM